MSTPGIIPVFDPQGILRDIPQDQLQTAVKAGGTPSVRFKAPNGDIRFVPANRTQDAIKNGGTLLPIEQQDIQHPGFWQSLGGDIKGLARGALQVPQMLSAGPAGFAPTAANMAINDMQRALEGRSGAYRAVAPLGEALGVNVRGMEESASQGDVGGVLGHAAAVPTVMAAGKAAGMLPLDRVARAGGAGIWGALKNEPLIGRPLRGAIRGAAKSWQASAPTTEISPSKVSTTAPEATPAVSLNRLTSDIQSLGYSKADALARAKAGIAKYPNDLNAATTEAMRSSALQQAKAPSTAPPSKSAQVAQARATSTTPLASPQVTSEVSKPAIFDADRYVEGRKNVAQASAEFQKNPSVEKAQAIVDAASSAVKDLRNQFSEFEKKEGQYEVAPPSRPLRIEGKDVPANTELTSAIQKSIPPNRIQGKIMQVVRREGTLGMDRLMQAPELQGLSREQVEAAAMSLGNSKKLWVPTKEADAHGPAGIISLAIRKP